MTIEHSHFCTGCRKPRKCSCPFPKKRVNWGCLSCVEKSQKQSAKAIKHIWVSLKFGRA